MDSDILYNQTMIRKLKATKKLHDSNITNALYSVNRSWFMPLRINDGTYEDIEYRSPSWFYYSDVPIHLFSPSLYVTILKQMDFQHGHSFLNIGSGTGYLSCLAGCLIGSSGKNVGIELQASLVHFAFIQRQKVIAFLEEADWGLPEILCLNIFEYKTKEKYDRIFVGASVKEHHRTFICRMLKNYGVAILAYYNELQKITNIGDNQYIVQTIEEVDFDEILEDDCKMPVKSCVYKPRETLDEWKKKVWEICQDYEAEFFIDYINGNACFYTFEEKANSAIKLIVGKYQIKYETRMMKQKQEKEAEKFGQELRKLKENQRMMEEKIEKVIADKENQDLEIKEFMKNENTSTADKIKNAKEFYGITDERSFNFAIAGHTKNW
uniref:Protein-L-isoaspartate O-methyltransferase n=1 Tax=Panagrolaimus superbus TaxID=310955 RepID=A0A914Y0I5_9BILA